MASLDQICDYLADTTIIEQGTSGSWYYRKFANGWVECWARFTPTIKAGTSYGNMYYAEYDINIAFPVTFAATPIVIITPASGSWGMLGDVTYNTTTLIKYDMYRGNGGNIGSNVSVYVFGRTE